MEGSREGRERGRREGREGGNGGRKRQTTLVECRTLWGEPTCNEQYRQFYSSAWAILCTEDQSVILRDDVIEPCCAENQRAIAVLAAGSSY